MNSPTAPFQGNHNGGQIRFGPDGKIYIQIGDNGRRGWLQNLPDGPFLPPAPDDEFGGPAPDDNHLTGSIFRLNDDGTTPADNPFFAAGGAMGGEVGANIQKLFSYGHRNHFGLAFDPLSGNLWNAENGDDAFDEINKVVAGGNYGWVQVMGPLSRVAQFKKIEMNLFDPGTGKIGTLQQIRYPTTRIAYTPALALCGCSPSPRDVSGPRDELAVRRAPAGIGFVRATVSEKLCRDDVDRRGSDEGCHRRDHGHLRGNRTDVPPAHLGPVPPGLDRRSRLADHVADNGTYPPPVGTDPPPGFKFDGNESESLLIGQNFGIVTDFQTGPDGGLYVVSNSDGAVYRISRVP